MQSASPQVKAKYEARAKHEKENRNIPITKYTSHGIPLTVIQNEQREMQDAIESEIQDIKNMVKTKAFNNSKFCSVCIEI